MLLAKGLFIDMKEQDLDIVVYCTHWEGRGAAEEAPAWIVLKYYISDYYYTTRSKQQANATKITN